MAESFKHPFLSEARWMSTIHPEDGELRHTMVVVPSLPINPDNSAFDAKDLGELVEAATAYVKSQGPAFDVQVFGI